MFPSPDQYPLYVDVNVEVDEEDIAVVVVGVDVNFDVAVVAVVVVVNNGGLAGRTSSENGGDLCVDFVTDVEVFP